MTLSVGVSSKEKIAGEVDQAEKNGQSHIRQLMPPYRQLTFLPIALRRFFCYRQNISAGQEGVTSCQLQNP